MTAAGFAALREQLPVLDERAYFDSQCLGPMPRAAFDDLEEYRRSLLLRSRALPIWLDWIEDVTGLVETLLAAPAGSVALRPNANDAQASIVAALSPRPGKDRIAFTTQDFHSTKYLWRAQARRDFAIDEVDASGNEPATERVIAAIDDRTAIVAAALVSPRTGALLDVAAVAAAARRHGAIFMLDAYQGVGIVPIDAPASGAHVVVGGTHKWLGGGGMGLAFMYVEPELSARLEPAYPGWLGHAELLEFSDHYVPAPGARRFQTGAPAMEPVYTSRAGLRFALASDVAAVRARQIELLDRMLARARDRGLDALAPSRAADRAGFLRIATPRAEAIAAALRARAVDIDVRPGAGLRIGPHFCHRDDECDRVIDAIAELDRG